MDAARDGHWDWIAETDNFYASPRMLEIYGFPPETHFSGRQDFLNRFPFYPEDEPGWRIAAHEHFTGSARRFDFELRLLRAGEIRWIRTTGLIARDVHGQPTRYTGSVSDITTRKASEAALRASQERFSLAVAATNDGIWDWDLLANHTFMSDRAQRLYGLDVGACVRPHGQWRALINYHPDDVLPQHDMVESYLAGRAPACDGEWRVRHADGNYRWVRVRGLCVRDAAGRATRLTGSITDIDEQKQTDQALRQSEKRHSLAMEASRDGHWDWNIERDEYYTSPRMLEIYGFPPDARFAGRADFVRQLTFHPEDRAKWEKAIAEHFAGTTARFEIELRMLRHGETRWIHFVGLLLRDASGSPLRWAGSLRDVTDRVAGESALRESRDRFSLAVAATNDGVWDLDALTDQMFMSDRAQRLHGLAVGASARPRSEWRDLVEFHPDDAQRRSDMFSGYLAGTSPAYDGEWRVRHTDGTYRWVRIRGLCVRDASGRALRMAGSISDIDTQKRAEAALLQAQRLEAVGTLAGGIAHDFNNILGAILGFGEMALRDARAGSRIRRDIELILTAGERGRSLVERILAFSRTGVGERVPVHLEGVVQEALNLLSASLPDNVRIESALHTASAAVIGDSTQVHQVLMNLAANAIQAMPEGGTLRVTLERLQLTAPLMATTGALGAGDYLVLCVGDTGAGIAPEILNRIFDPFFTTKEVGSGTGLGLSLVHGIVSELGGAVDIATVLGTGSTFTVYLPRVGDVSPKRDDEPVALPRGAHEQVLLVDDEEPLLRLMTDTLSELGYLPVGFTSSVEALAAFEAHPDRFDAVITDERMPRLLVSGYLGEEVVGRARQAGADAVLRKPLSIPALANSLARAIRFRGPELAVAQQPAPARPRRTRKANAPHT
jgi:PAS domain S-box-containing protein